MRKQYRTLTTAQKFEARQFRESGMSVLQCSQWFNVSAATMKRGLAEMREKFGPEKLPPRLAGRQRHTVSRRVEPSAHAGQ